MNKTALLLCLLIGTLLPLTDLAAKNKAESSAIEAFFSARLAGDTEAVYDKSKKIKPKDVAAMRDMVWDAWRQANSSAKECKLPEPTALDSAQSHSWPIPAELEPDATMPYLFGFKGEASGKRPLFILLHGSGPKDYEWDVMKQISVRFEDAPSAYFIPQIPNEGEWYRWYQRGKQWAWERVLRQALLRDDIDADKVYFMGISEGAYGSQRLASFYADYLAGAGPMAGGEPLMNAPAENLRNTALLLRTGEKDYGFYRNYLSQVAGVKLDSMQRLYPGLYEHKVEIIPGAGHSIDYRPTPPWLRQHTRNPYPKSVYWENFEMDGRYRDGFYNIYVDARSNADDKQRTCYGMNIDGNVIDMTVQLVSYEPSLVGNDFGFPIAVDYRKTYTPATEGQFTVYLNDELVDLGKEVTLRVNGREVYRGKLTPNLNDMVNSCARYYERARIYPTSISVKLTK